MSTDRYEDHLRTSLGYEVPTFVRSASELEAIAGYRPFASSELGVESNSLYIAYLLASPTAEAQQNLMIFRGEVDDFAVDGREVYHLCRKRMSESSLYGAPLEKTMCMPATIRNATTVEEIVAKYPASE